LPDAYIEILRAVADRPAITPRAIADQLGLARPTVSNQLQAMKRDGLVSLDRSDTDARVVHVTATDFATGLLSRYDTASHQILSAALSQLSTKEQAAVTAAVPALSRLQAILTSRSLETG
jgi:DNA-binding MarR family transcriptional regulator